MRFIIEVLYFLVSAKATGTPAFWEYLPPPQMMQILNILSGWLMAGTQ